MAVFRGENSIVGPNAAVAFPADGSSTRNYKLPLYEFVAAGSLGAVATQGTLFIAPPASASDGIYKVTKAIVSVETVSSASVTIDIKKAADGTALSSGTSILASTQSLNTITASTQTPLSMVTDNSNTIAAGSRVGWVISGTPTALANGFVQLYIERV